MKQYGIIGYPLSHSWSKIYFTNKFRDLKLNDHSYHNFEIKEVSQLKSLIADNHHLCGLNVTIPHKTSIINQLDKIKKIAKEIGAVNTIQIIRSGSSIKTIGYNTDHIGFKHSLLPILSSRINHALILGNGGAAKTVQYILKKSGFNFLTISRQGGDMTYQELTDNHIKMHKLIINTTPLGMYPHVDTCPDIPYQYLTSEHVLFDLVYNPTLTLFLKQGKKMGTETVNGAHMLHIQAEQNWVIWNNK